MKKNLEVIFDANPNGGCGCNCGCAGSSIIKDMSDLVENLKKHKFNSELEIDLLPISDLESVVLIDKINDLLNNTNATFRVTAENLEETLSNMLPMVVLNGSILTAYGVPRLNDVIFEVENSL